MRPLLALPLAALLLGTAAAAQPAETKPQPVPVVDLIPAPRDIPFPGTMRVDVDATDTARGIFRVVQTVPVPAAGRMTLMLPQYLPGNHSPSGTINLLAGLKVSGNGAELPWIRDTAYVYAFHVDVPAGVRELRVEFQHLSPVTSAEGRITMTPAMLNAQWEKMSLYPAGYFVRNVPVVASIRLPAGWQAATSLDVARREGDRIVYRPVSYETFVDSPLLAGINYRRVPLGSSVNLNLFADRPEDLAAADAQLAVHRRLVDQALKAFGTVHFDEYEFLVSLTDELGDIGLEHLRSSENGHPRDYFTGWDRGSAGRDLLAHEFTHSWNGKYRRPADLWTPDYRTPMRNSLLWVYEGQTQFWGYVLSARSGLMPVDDVKAELARSAAYFDTLPGRSWRPVLDTTNDPIINARRPIPWTSWQRSEDYYQEGMLIWLDVDSILRERSGGSRSIDDFARAFFGANPGAEGSFTYTRADVVKTLESIVPYGWADFFAQRVDRTGPAPLDWLARGGYRLAYSEKAPAYFASRERAREILDLSFSAGFVVGKGGVLASVAWGSPLFEAGVTPGSTIIAVNGQAYSDAGMKAAITAAKGGKTPIALLIKRGERFRTVELPYHGGLRYPVLESTGKGPSGLDALLAAR